MRRIFKVSVLCLAAGVVGACRPDETIPTENIPTAGVRFINAVPDSQPVDFRFVDFIESNAHFRIAFRNAPVTTAGVTASTQVQFKNARAGSRRYRVFLNDTLQAVASTQIVPEGTFTFNAGTNYTVLLWGWAAPNDATVPRVAGSPAMTLDIFAETVADPGAQVAVRVINATRSDIEWRHFVPTGAPCTGTVPAAATQTVAAKTVGTHVLVNPDTLCINVQPAGGGTALFANARALVGIPANSSGARNPTTGALLPCGGAGQLKCDIEATPGTTIAGSAVSAIVFPGSTPCSRAPQTSDFLNTTGNTAIVTARAGSSPTTSGFARPTGSFTTNGIAVGQVIGVCGFTQAANNGLFSVTAVTATTIDAVRVGQTCAAAGQPGCTVLEGGTTGGAAGNFGASTTGYTRVTGSFLTDGFVPGQTITVSGFTQAANNGVATISTAAGSVTANTITVTKTGLLTEAATTGAQTIGATAAAGTTPAMYTCAACNFSGTGWVPGMSITTSGFLNAANNGTSTILAVRATEIDVVKVGGLVTEIAAPARTISTAATRTIANAGVRLIASERPFISYIWDRRPPRPADMQ